MQSMGLGTNQQAVLQQQQPNGGQQPGVSQQQQQVQQPQQSRLNQWKLPSPDRDSGARSGPGGDLLGINKAVGSRPNQHLSNSHSSPNLQITKSDQGIA